MGISPHFTAAREKSAVSAGLAISYLSCSAVRAQEQHRKRLIHSNSDGFAEKEKRYLSQLQWWSDTYMRAFSVFASGGL